MIQTPGKHSPTIKNRSSKHLYLLTRRGNYKFNEWQREKGIPEYKEKKNHKKVKKVEDGKSEEKSK